MKNKMTEKEIRQYCLNKLFNEIPEILLIKGELKEELDEALEDNLGAHIIYEDIFSYFILDLINKTQPSLAERDILKRSFRLIESLAHNSECEIRYVAQVSFIEPLLDKIKPTSRIKNYLLPKSLELAQEIGSFRFGLDPETLEKRKK